MKKVGLLCLALVLALGIMGAALAWWTETLAIGPNPVTTGELKMKWTDMFGEYPLPKYADAAVAQVYNANGVWAPPGTTQYLPLTDSTFTLKLRNMFPDAYYHVYWLRCKNAGTIPAKIQSVALQNLNDPGNIKGYVEWKSPWKLKIIRADGTEVRPPGTFDWTPIELVPGKYQSFLTGYVLFPGDRLEFDADEPEEPCFSIRLSPLAPNSAEGYTFSYDIVFTWTQFNAP